MNITIKRKDIEQKILNGKDVRIAHAPNVVLISYQKYCRECIHQIDRDNFIAVIVEEI